MPMFGVDAHRSRRALASSIMERLTMNRRAFVTGLGAVLAAPLAAETFSGSCQATCF